MNELVQDTGRAVAFLSRLPVPERFFEGDTVSISRPARAYGFAGLVISLPGALVLSLLLVMGLAPLFAAALAVSCHLLVTGALHEDGLADCADGFGGGSDRDRTLTIMKDSTIGAYGGIALVMSLVLRVAGIAALAGAVSPVAATLGFLAAGVVSRAAMVWHWQALPAAKTDGVAASAGQPDDGSMRFALISGAVLGFVLALRSIGAGGAVFMLVLVAAACIAFTRFAERKIGGHTGDTIGATQQICEVAALLGLALWS
ncbi:MAG: adenosylcobinamide-GDP ribazoletransferase [Alphaproteobacteria bacterium]|nr:adenosylcobinamide-GDP ribazoletransferase [Alphaproteobacteria bacterium]